MPYIKPDYRTMIRRDLLESLEWRIAELNAGALNYALTRIVNAWIDERGESYDTFNTVMGVLESVKLELYRRRIARYEDEKCAENGDVY